MSRYIRIHRSLPLATSHGPIARSLGRIPARKNNLQDARTLTTTCRRLSGTTGTGQTRKQITVASDDGRLRWGELSGREKAARATQQSMNFVIVVIGAVMTVRNLNCGRRHGILGTGD